MIAVRRCALAVAARVGRRFGMRDDELAAFLNAKFELAPEPRIARGRLAHAARRRRVGTMRCIGKRSAKSAYVR